MDWPETISAICKKKKKSVYTHTHMSVCVYVYIIYTYLGLPALSYKIFTL